MDSLSSVLSITREEFNAFHSHDRALFFCLVITLRRDIRQSYQIMSFLLYVMKTARNLSNLIANLASSLDVVVNMVADQVATCLMCMSYEDFPAFVANLRIRNIPPEIPYITDITGGFLDLIAIHNNRVNILIEMKQLLTRVCVPAFEDICVRAEIYYREIEARRRAIARRNQMVIGRFLQNGESGGRRVSGGPQRRTNGGRGNTDDRTIFLAFSRGDPFTRAELHAYFTWRLGTSSIEAIHMGGAGGVGQALYAAMVLSSPSKIPEILIEGLSRTKYTINGKHVWARKLIPSNNPSSYNNYPGPHSYGNFF